MLLSAILSAIHNGFRYYVGGFSRCVLLGGGLKVIFAMVRLHSYTAPIVGLARREDFGFANQLISTARKWMEREGTERNVFGGTLETTGLCLATPPNPWIAIRWYYNITAKRHFARNAIHGPGHIAKYNPHRIKNRKMKYSPYAKNARICSDGKRRRVLNIDENCDGTSNVARLIF